jgi:probable rRNA maturation factor
VSVLITDDAELRRLNKTYRDVDKPTDVLSFPMLDLKPGRFDPSPADIDNDTGLVPLGDIVLSYDRVLDQARRFGHTPDREAAYLAVHSALHLLGYDHTDEGADKRAMRAREKAILKEMGLGDEKEL